MISTESSIYGHQPPIGENIYLMLQKFSVCRMKSCWRRCGVGIKISIKNESLTKPRDPQFFYWFIRENYTSSTNLTYPCNFRFIITANNTKPKTHTLYPTSQPPPELPTLPTFPESPVSSPLIASADRHSV